MDNTEAIKAHEELMKVVEKYDKEFEGSVTVPSVCSIGREIERLEKEEEFGIQLAWVDDGYFSVAGAYDNWSRVLYFSEESGRSISWPDDGRQPENEWLYVVSFPTGPYIFGGEYPEETFRAFFAELKQFEPKYCDTANKSLYFTGSKAKAVHEDFWHIFNKYKDEVEKELKQKRRDHLLKELEKLKEEERGGVSQ